MTLDTGFQPHEPEVHRTLPSTPSALRHHHPLRVKTLEDFLTEPFPPRQMLLAPWLPMCGLAFVYAPRGVGKTHFALGVAHAVAGGGTFLGWTAPSPREVLLLDGEMPAAMLQDRLSMIVAKDEANTPALQNLRIASADLSEFGLPDLSTERGQDEIDKIIGEAKLIVVDNLSTICRTGKENDAESWAEVQAWALGKRFEGRAVLFIHHANKAGDQRGTSRHEDVMDTVIKLSRPKDYNPAEGTRLIGEFTKSRGFMGPEAEAFQATLRDGEWRVAKVEDVRKARVLELARDGLTQREIAAEVSWSLATVNRTLKQAREAGELLPSRETSPETDPETNETIEGSSLR